MNILLSLAVGLVLIVLVFFGFNRGLRLPARQAAVILAILTLGFYLPYALLNWDGGDVLAIHLAVYLMTVFILGLLAFQREQKLPADGRNFRWGPGMIIGFFAVIIAMNSMFVTFAIHGVNERVTEILLPKPRHAETVTSNFPGVISHNYHKKEALYNQYLQRVAQQNERGWQVSYGWLGEVIAKQASVFQVYARDKQGEPILGGSVTVNFLRPSDINADFSVDLTEAELGMYRNEISPPIAGLWQVVILVRRGDDVHEIRASTDVLTSASAKTE